MPVLKATWQGVMCSFRYPHFMAGRQPSYPVPPPSTLYGLLCAATGGYFDPRRLRFAYAFSHAGRTDDLEHQHLTERLSGQRRAELAGQPANLEANVNPVPREVFLFPSLDLYLEGGPVEALAVALRAPRYTPTLGRSQDVGSFVRVVWQDLDEADEAYVMGTLTPRGLASHPSQTLSMPRFIPPWDRTQAAFATYDVVLRPAEVRGDRMAIDPEAPRHLGGRPRAVPWLTFRDDAEAWPQGDAGLA
jgi:CRISPR-associated protein Cas5t